MLIAYANQISPNGVFTFSKNYFKCTVTDIKYPVTAFTYNKYCRDVNM